MVRDERGKYLRPSMRREKGSDETRGKIESVQGELSSFEMIKYESNMSRDG